MTWRKLGRLFDPGAHPRCPKLITHAANPVPIRKTGDVYQIFYSGRDAQNRSSVGAVELNIFSGEIMRLNSDPVFEHGPLGSFYADGVSLGNPYEAKGEKYLLFMGWQNPSKAHWRGDIGRLRIHKDNSLSLDSTAPFLGADSTDPISLSYPWVLSMAAGSYHMWYGSTITWDAGNREMLHVIHHATSRDGNCWQRKGLAIPYEIGVAQAFSRPTVVPAPQGGFEMWYSYRSGQGSSYRIGYASSVDGECWNSYPEKSGIDVSSKGWDSEMIEYPFVFDHEGDRFMIYNGNRFGNTGFGLAVLEK